MMVVSGEVAAIKAEVDKDRQSDTLQTFSREWYFRASSEYSSLLVGSELERIMQYAVETDTRARNLGALWMTDPFPEDLFIREAVCIIEQSDAIEDNVTLLKNTVVRFMHACKHDGGKMPRSRRVRRRIVRRCATPDRRQHKDHEQLRGGNP